MSGFRKFRGYLIPTLLITILAVSVLATYTVYSGMNQSKGDPTAYVGVAFCGNTTQQAELLIDRVKSYTNLFVLATGRNPISTSQKVLKKFVITRLPMG